MGGVADKHVEWAIVNRLKAMLDEPPKTKFNVTQSFSLFSTILLWTKNRGWVAGNGEPEPWFSADDLAAHQFRKGLAGAKITEAPWALSSRTPQNLAAVDPNKGGAVNEDFKDMNAEDFIKWLRDALGHGDGRTIRPLHRHRQRDPNKTWLVGFEIQFARTKNSNEMLCLNLYEPDMRRIGSQIADLFCQSLSGGNAYFLEEIGTMRVEEYNAA